MDPVLRWLLIGTGAAILLLTGGLLWLGSGPSYDQQESRVRSPDGKLDAVYNLHDNGGGATVGFVHEVYILPVPPPENWRKDGVQVYEANGGDLDLAWADADTLLIATNSRASTGAKPRTVKVFDGIRKRNIRVQEMPLLPGTPDPADATAARAAP